MKNHDFKPYDDIIESKNYEGFIDPKGRYYRVKRRGAKTKIDSHNSWAEDFIKEKYVAGDIKMNDTISALFALSQINGPAEVLVHFFGFVYYSHALYNLGPIVILPNKKIASRTVTEEQLDTLYTLMFCNNELKDYYKVMYDEDSRGSYLYGRL